MLKILKIAIRNLKRYKRRTFLTASLITIGIVFVLVFVSVTASFKGMMIGQITDSMVGHIQIHKKGYVASIDNLPLTIALDPQSIRKAEAILKELPEIESYSLRIRFGGMFSNFVETTNIRLNGVNPEREFKTVPLLSSRILKGDCVIKRGEIIVPELLAEGMEVQVGDLVSVIATNKDGSVNGNQFKVGGIIESVIGPQGRDTYIHIDDAKEILRMSDEGKSTAANEAGTGEIDYEFDMSEVDNVEETSEVPNEVEISEIAIRLKDFRKLHEVNSDLNRKLSQYVNNQGKPVFEVHTWEKLNPFFNIARMIDLMVFFIKLMLIAIVLISIMNVMIMAVYERIREIGTIAAIGTMPRKILALFVTEGLSLGVFGTAIGNILGIGIILVLNAVKPAFDFGRQTGLVLQPTINPTDAVAISVTVILVSVIASLQPAYKASRMDPIKALRHV